MHCLKNFVFYLETLFFLIFFLPDCCHPCPSPHSVLSDASVSFLTCQGVMCVLGDILSPLANLKRCPESFLCQNLYFWPRTIPLKWWNQRLPAIGSCVLLCSRCLPLLVMSRGPCTRHSELGTRVVWAEVGRPVPEQEPLETVQWSEPQTQEEQHSPTWLHCLGWTLGLASSLLGVGFVYSSPHPCHTHII